jgi:CHAT domain-containing protein/Flp pilus assembly protein TadD
MTADRPQMPAVRRAGPNAMLFRALLPLILMVCCGPATGQAATEDAPRAAVDAYIRAVLGREIASALKVCTARPALLPKLQALTAEAIALGMASDAAVRVLYRIGDNEMAVVRLIVGWSDAKGKHSLALDFRVDREPEGWLIQGTRDANEYVKQALVTAAGADAWREIIAGNLELIDAALALQIRRDATELSRKSKHDEALRSSDAAFAVAESLQSDYEIGYCYLNRGTLWKRKTEWNPALADYEMARKHFSKAKDAEGEAKTQTYAAAIYSQLGLMEKALKFYRSGLETARANHDEDAEANALQDISGALKHMGKPGEALTLNREARAIRARRKERSKEATLMANEAGILGDLERHGEALALLYKALGVLRDANEAGSVGYALVSLGYTLESVGRPHEARDQYIEARRAFETVDDKYGQMMALHNLAGIQAKLGDIGRALDSGVLSAKLADEIDERRFQAQTHGLLQQILLQEKRYVEALEYLGPGLEAARAMGNRVQEASVLMAAGFALTRLGRADEARQRLDQARVLSEATASLLIQQQVWGCYGDLAAARKDWPTACAAYAKAITFVERRRLETREQSLKSSLLRQHVPTYRSLIQSLVETGNVREAFAASERAKARSLGDLLQGGKVNLRKKMTTGERQRERALEDRLQQLAKQMEGAVSTDEIDGLQLQIEKVRREADEFRLALYLQRPDLETRRAEFRPVALSEINAAILAPAPGTAVLSYTFLRDECFLFVVDRPRGDGARLTLVRTSVSVDDIRADAEALWRNVAVPTGNYTRSARSLFGRLVAPAARLLAGKSHLVIVPDSSAPPMPFAALLDARNQPLAARYSISYAPSVTALVRMVRVAGSRKTAGKGLLAVGSPRFARGFTPLPATADEVRRIAALAKGKARILTGLSATRPSVEAAAHHARYIHFATHGILNEISPMQSAVVLSKSGDDDGLLRARDMADMNLNADLVVLSACETALGRQFSGEGVLGLTWALFVGGATASIASQWQVYDESTRTLMVDLYRRLFATGAKRASMAEALRQAQMAVRRNPKYAHPYYWAPFALSGAWLR